MVAQADYQIRVYDTAGAAQAVLTQWYSLDFERRLNDFDLLTLVLHASDPRIALFVQDAILEIWRKPEGVDWYREACFFHITPRIEYTETDNHLFTTYGRGLLDLLHRREIRYTNSLATQTGPGETVILTYVDYNAGPNANNAGRKSDGRTLGLTLDSDSGLGSVWTGERAFRNLLDVIQEISGATGVDFTLERVGYSGQSFVFRTGYPTIGTDRTATVKFGTRWGNLLAPSYTKSNTEEINSVAALGSGSGIARSVLVVSDAIAVATSPWNLREGSTSAGNTSTAAQLQSAAEQELAKGQPDESFNGHIIQTAPSQYGIQYFLGDLVSAEIDDIIRTKKITAVHINVGAGRETIDVQFSDYGRL